PLLVRLVSLQPPAPTYIYTLSLHDALPIFLRRGTVGDREVVGRGIGHHTTGLVGEAHRRPAAALQGQPRADVQRPVVVPALVGQDRKSTRLNSSHLGISYAVFCLKKKREPI